MTILAILLSALALASGLMVVGSGKHFTYRLGDLLKGRENALLYMWVTASTMISMVHLTMLMEFGFKYNFGDKDAETSKWMLLHGAMSAMFIAAHLIVKRVLIRNESKPTRYLWGSPSYAY